MRLFRPALAALGVLAAALAVPADARAARPLELTSTTVVTTARSGYVDVVLPVDAWLSPRRTGNPDVSIVGRGRFVGVWLERQSEEFVRSPDHLQVTRLPSFLGSAQETSGSQYPADDCTNVPNDTAPVTQDCTNPPPAKAILLHEGKYRLRVLVDNAPLTVTLHLHGLDEGARAVSLAHRLASVQKPLTQRESLQDKVVTFGGSVPTLPNSEAWIIAAVKGRGTGTIDGAEGCARSDNGEPPAYAYAPGCLGGHSRSYSYLVHAGGQTTGLVGLYLGTTLPRDTTTMGLGGSFSGDNGRTFVAGLGAWLQRP